MVVCHKLAPAAFQPLSLTDTVQQIWSIVLKAVPLLVFGRCQRIWPIHQYILLRSNSCSSFSTRGKHCRFQIYRSQSKKTRWRFRGKAPFLISYISSNSYDSLCDLSHKIHLENFDYCSWEYNYCGSAQSRWTDYITALIHTIWCLCRYENNTVLQQRCLLHTVRVCMKPALTLMGQTSLQS